MSDEGRPSMDEFKKGRGGIVVASVITAAVIVFIAQNTADTEVTWLFFDGTAPLWIVLVVAVVAGAVLSEAVGFLWRRRRQP